MLLLLFWTRSKETLTRYSDGSAREEIVRNTEHHLLMLLVSPPGLGRVEAEV